MLLFASQSCAASLYIFRLLVRRLSIGKGVYYMLLRFHDNPHEVLSTNIFLYVCNVKRTWLPTKILKTAFVAFPLLNVRLHFSRMEKR
jgi:hypothetical protein